MSQGHVACVLRFVVTAFPSRARTPDNKWATLIRNQTNFGPFDPQPRCKTRQILPKFGQQLDPSPDIWPPGEAKLDPCPDIGPGGGALQPCVMASQDSIEWSLPCKSAEHIQVALILHTLSTRACLKRHIRMLSTSNHQTVLSQTSSLTRNSGLW